MNRKNLKAKKIVYRGKSLLDGFRGLPKLSPWAYPQRILASISTHSSRDVLATTSKTYFKHFLLCFCCRVVHLAAPELIPAYISPVSVNAQSRAVWNLIFCSAILLARLRSSFSWSERAITWKSLARAKQSSLHKIDHHCKPGTTSESTAQIYYLQKPCFFDIFVVHSHSWWEKAKIWKLKLKKFNSSSIEKR